MIGCNIDNNGYFFLDHGFIVANAPEDFSIQSNQVTNESNQELDKGERRKQQVDVVMNKVRDKLKKKGGKKSTTTQRTKIASPCESNSSNT